MEVGIGLPNAVVGATGEQLVQFAREAFEEVGCDELVFFPSSADAEQPALLREALEG